MFGDRVWGGCGSRPEEHEVINVDGRIQTADQHLYTRVCSPRGRNQGGHSLVPAAGPSRVGLDNFSADGDVAGILPNHLQLEGEYIAGGQDV